METAVGPEDVDLCALGVVKSLATLMSSKNMGDYDDEVEW
ncbi:hypothetical protein MNBD_ALPHA05-403 [hydrothermal vent metagenome]|uniref:Uncharacterized protein n=1 Tax=hydrothermal vent metagenome TaxID=652676 RepID=A0A3B0SX39_9ZZZZ